MIEGHVPWNSACRDLGCAWIQEKDFNQNGWWFYHKSAGGNLASMEDRLFISTIDVLDDFGKVQQAVLGYYDAHHARPALEDFDEERERARLVAV